MTNFPTEPTNEDCLSALCVRCQIRQWDCGSFFSAPQSFWRSLRAHSNWFPQLCRSLKFHFYCLWESLSCSVLGMEIASKLSFQHLASLSWDQLTSKVLKLYVCRCEGAVATFIHVSEGDMWLCPSLLTGDVRRCDFCVVFLCRQGQQLEPSDKYMFNRMEGGRSMLTIRNIRQSDGGSYACRADNKAGSQERELFLKVFGKVDGKSWNKLDWSALWVIVFLF